MFNPIENPVKIIDTRGVGADSNTLALREYLEASLPFFLDEFVLRGTTPQFSLANGGIRYTRLDRLVFQPTANTHLVNTWQAFGGRTINFTNLVKVMNDLAKVIIDEYRTGGAIFK